MNNKFESYKRTLNDLGPIVFRNVVLLTNIIIYAVIILLFVFHQTQAALFLSTAIVIAILIGIVQDIRARLALEKLQLLTALRYVRMNSNGTEETVLAEQIKKDNRIKLKLGDQIPCDGILISPTDLEANNALLTGESQSFPVHMGEKILAGSIVTAGSGVLRVMTPFADSRISQMTKNIKQYSLNYSPIQRSINLVIQYSGYLLVVVILFVIVRGTLVNDSVVRIIKNVGALASTLVPQGLVLATTILFAYGAVNLFRKHVLLQEINATEKLGRIKNLCLDKTGTLTENILVVEEMQVPAETAKQTAEELIAAYLRGSDDSSETMRAVRKFITRKYQGQIIKSVPFSSFRQYGAVSVKDDSGEVVIFIAGPEIFLQRLNQAEQTWLEQILANHAHDGKRLLCVARADGGMIPSDLPRAKLSLVAVFVFYNNLRPGIRDVISFFQERGVVIRVISGDNPATVHAVTVLSGVNNPDAIITGPEIETWSQDDFDKKTPNYTIFARINPEQKEKIIAGFKKSGFTAMVGDGANDALAMKKADLGIAMFDGAPATRRLAAVVLMNNSFMALPGGVAMADHIIGNIEIMAGLFINQSAIGLVFFIILSLFGYAYPFTPLNITLIDYFTVGFPSMVIFVWAVRDWTEKQHLTDSRSFLQRVLPFAFSSAIFQGMGAAVIFAVSPQYLKIAQSNVLAAIAFIIFGFVFFIFTPGVYRGVTTRAQKLMFAAFGAFEALLLYLVFQIPFLLKFFDITYLTGVNIFGVALVFMICALLQYELAKWFWKPRGSLVGP